MILLPLEQQPLSMRIAQDIPDDPLGDLRAMQTRGRGQRDGGVSVDGGLADVVYAGADEVDELELRRHLWIGGQRGEREEDRHFFPWN